MYLVGGDGSVVYLGGRWSSGVSCGGDGSVEYLEGEMD